MGLVVTIECGRRRQELECNGGGGIEGDDRWVVFQNERYVFQKAFEIENTCPKLNNENLNCREEK